MSNPIVDSTVTLQATFRDIDEVLVDPSTVTLTIEAPDGTVTTPAFTNPSTGVYQYQLTLTAAGDWDFQWEGDTSQGTVICEGRVCAIASSVV